MSLRVYVGYDARDHLAYKVCEASLKATASVPVDVRPLKIWELRRQGYFWRSYHVDKDGIMTDDRDGKPFGTDFSFTRFCVPVIEDYGLEPVVFCDPDMLWQADVAELVNACPDWAGVACVQHDHRPPEHTKGVGLQQVYRRKNWSSLMVLRPWRCDGLTRYAVNNMSGSWLHQMCWIDDTQIAGLDESWNWLAGWSAPTVTPKVIHFTRGTPDMPGYEHEPYAELWQEWAEKV